MYKVILFDGTEITNCLDGTTSDVIRHGGETYAEAASVMDIIRDENASVIRVEDEDGTVISSSGNLALIPGGTLEVDTAGNKVCIINLRHKTEMEIIQDQIAELQEAIIEG